MATSILQDYLNPIQIRPKQEEPIRENEGSLANAKNDIAKPMNHHFGALDSAGFAIMSETSLNDLSKYLWNTLNFFTTAPLYQLLGMILRLIQSMPHQYLCLITLDL